MAGIVPSGRSLIGLLSGILLLHFVYSAAGLQEDDDDNSKLVGEWLGLLPASHGTADHRVDRLNAGGNDHGRKHERQHRGRRPSADSDDPSPSRFETCGRYTTCDRRTHFCDRVVDECARCDDACHPARIEGNSFATADCRRKCALWYKLQSELQKTDARNVGESVSADKQSNTSNQLQQSLMIIITCALLVIAVSFSTTVFILLVCACKRSGGPVKDSTLTRTPQLKALPPLSSSTSVVPLYGKFKGRYSASDVPYLPLAPSKYDAFV